MSAVSAAFNPLGLRAQAPARRFRADALRSSRTVVPKAHGRVPIVRAAVSDPKTEPNPAEKTAVGMGFDISEGYFGFTPFAELWVGRLAMAGFAVGMAEELWTGKGILRQIGFETPSPPLFVALLALIVGGSGYGAARTLAMAQNGEMTYGQFKKYAAFLGADTDELAKKMSIELKRGGDFLGPDSAKDIAAARKSMPADTVLGLGDAAAADAAASAMKAATADSPLGQLPVEATEEAAAALKAAEANVGRFDAGAVYIPEKRKVDAETAYAMSVEMDNGRAAMLGFAIAILLEARTGASIVDQLIFYCKVTGLLGPDSGL